MRVLLEQSQEEVMLSVSGEGVSIPPDEYERIFEPFRRSKGSSAEIFVLQLQTSDWYEAPGHLAPQRLNWK